MLFAAASAEPSRGWGGPLGLLAALVVFRLLMPWMHKLREKIKNSSPPPALPAGSLPKVQATVGVNPREPRPDQRYEWGAIGYEQPAEVEPYDEPERPGWRHRIAQARQVMTTGSHVLPEPEVEPEPPADDAIDLALDDDEPEEAEERGPDAEKSYINRALNLGIPYNQIVKVLIEHYGISKSTAKNRIREVRAARQQ